MRTCSRLSRAPGPVVGPGLRLKLGLGLRLCLGLGLGLGVGACSSEEDPTAPFSNLPVSDTLTGGVAQPVEILRDQYGVPHIYAHGILDGVYAQGYVMAQDRLVQMDLLRHYASGTLAELFGALDESFIDRDIALRVHHMRKTAEQSWEMLRASQAPDDRRLVQILERFAAGVNAGLAEVQAGTRRLSGVFALVYDPSMAAPWTPVDSLSLARLQAFDLSYDADTELTRTQAEAAAFFTFDQSGDPRLRSRRGLASDLFRVAPLDPAAILPDATVCKTGQSAVGGAPGPRDTAAPRTSRQAAARIAEVLAAMAGAGPAGGRGGRTHEQLGSNNWVVAPRLTADGRAILANDTHLTLNNPAIFHQSHLNISDEKLNLMGVQFAGLPGAVLGMNDRLAWGSTTTYADVTDVYEEHLLTCDGAPCVAFRDPQKGGAEARVKLVPRVERIGVGRYGKILSQREVTLWDVPHHGPILPRLGAHEPLPLGPVEFSVRYTGHQPSFEVRAVVNLDRARSVAEGLGALEADFSVGSQNWVLADVEGHIGWTSHVTLPRRPAQARPWVVLPADGSAEWMPEGVPAAQQPRAVDPPCGLIVSANNDPQGATIEGAPQPAVYHGWNYDPGARAGRITARLRQQQGQLSVIAMQGIQGDHRSFLGAALLPVLQGIAADLKTELGKPGSFRDLTEAAAGVDADTRARLDAVIAKLARWQLGTPAGIEHEGSAAEVAESIAASVFNTWLAELHARTLGDELLAIDEAHAAQQIKIPRPDSDFQRKLLLTAALRPETLTVGQQASGDSVLFDDLRTAERVETRREIGARALLAALGQLAAALGPNVEGWQWGRLHRLTLSPLLPVAELAVPPPSDPTYGKGVPRHGDVFSVDASGFGARFAAVRPLSDFTYGHGPAIRFVAELFPDGPRAWNVLPGGEVFDPDSPHYADQFALWKKNQAIALPFRSEDVAGSAAIEASLSRPARVRLVP